MFLNGLVVRDDAQPRMWVIAEPLIWEDEQFGRIVVPLGFRTNLASTPLVVRDFDTFDPDGASRRPAALHDWNYTWHGLDKEHADELLRESLLSVGVSPRVAETFYEAVHAFGLDPWNAHSGGPTPDMFNTTENFRQWIASTNPNFSTTIPDVLA